MRGFKMYFDKCTALLLITAILAVSCSMSPTGPGPVSSAALISSAGRAINSQLDLIRNYVEIDPGMRGVLDGLDGYDIATRTMEEENGRAYLEFCLSGQNYKTVDEVIEAASTLAPEKELEEVREKTEEVSRRLFREAETATRYLTSSQKKEFYSDLTKLVVKCSVLLVAAIVYAHVPTAVFWGKVTAAAAVAITAGLITTSILAVIQHYKLDMDVGESFQNWLETVTTEPTAALAIATAMFTLGTSLGRSPVVSSIVLGIFTMVGVVDDAKTMLAKYNFSF